HTLVHIKRRPASDALLRIAERECGRSAIGAALRIPHLGWVLRGFWGRYYQAPPLLTVTGPVLDLAAQQGFSFLPLRRDRDQQHEFGLTVRLRGWTLALSHCRTGAQHLFCLGCGG